MSAMGDQDVPVLREGQVLGHSHGAV